VPAHGLHDGHAPIRQQLAQVAHLPDARAHVVVLHRFFDADRQRFHVAAGHAAVGVQPFVDHHQVARQVEHVRSFTASQPPMLTRLSFLALIQAPSV
jgi:hypothetical protein